MITMVNVSPRIKKIWQSFIFERYPHMFSLLPHYVASHFKTSPGVNQGMDADESPISLGFKLLIYLDELTDEHFQLDCIFLVPSIRREVVDLHPKGAMREIHSSKVSCGLKYMRLRVAPLIVHGQ